MTSVSAGHIILTPTKPVGSGRPQRESNPGPPHQESRALLTELPRPPPLREKEEEEEEGGGGGGGEGEGEKERERVERLYMYLTILVDHLTVTSLMSIPLKF